MIKCQCMKIKSINSEKSVIFQAKSGAIELREEIGAISNVQTMHIAYKTRELADTATIRIFRKVQK